MKIALTRLQLNIDQAIEIFEKIQNLFQCRHGLISKFRLSPFRESIVEPRADIDPAEYEPERFELHGTELYVWMPEGQIKSRLNKVLTDDKLGVAATNRNWNTLLKLDEMAAA